VKVFLAKITNRENVDATLNKLLFIHQDIYNFESEININDHIFIYFSGDKSKIDWEQGLVGYGKISKAPFDKGYSPGNSRYFKIEIQPIVALKHPIPPKETKLHKKYQDQLYDVPYVGANHFPNQAIAKAEGTGAVALFKLMSEYDNSITDYYPPEVSATNNTVNIPQVVHHSLNDGSFQLLPKPFLLLAGISGTGKTRFVREQADASAAVERYQVKKDDNFCLVPVRPDWHEPSDLLGYISRIGSDGPRYVTTDLLHFIIAAWRHAVASSSVAGIVYKPMDSICPFWLCLDEMNLAPVEQYFADYLSILETRRWTDGTYTCDPLLKSAVIQQQLGESGKNDFWGKLNLAGDDPLSSGLRDYFSTVGIPIPPNLIVAGTVNMDETTHGFSRKVIDRALTIDFGEFFRNDYGQFFTPENRPKTFGFPVLSHITRNDLSGVKADPEGQGTIGLLEAVNGILKDTPFELAYRALNEALLSVVCFNPSDDTQLQAVWDDFLMMKVLPRIEGDADKLNSDGEASMLTRLSDILQEKLSGIWEGGRPDLLSEKAADGSPVMTFCRSKKKLAWMQNRLAVNAFTTFWP